MTINTMNGNRVRVHNISIIEEEFVYRCSGCINGVSATFYSIGKPTKREICVFVAQKLGL